MTPQDDREDLGPYVELAREIRAEVARVAATGPLTGEGLEAAVRAVPDRERRRAARAVFDRLGAEQQWAVLERVFADEEIRSFLADLRAARREEAERRAGDLALARAARAERRIALDRLPPGTEVTLGLFRPADVQDAVARGAASSTCARQLVVRTHDRGHVRVLTDVFNPHRGYFVTADYDEAVWATEQLAGHRLVRLGAAGAGGDDGGGDALEAVLYPGGRVDVVLDGTVRPGRLHLGFALIGREDVFAETP